MQIFTHKKALGEVNTISREICSQNRYNTLLLAVEAGLYSIVIECLPLDPAAQV